MSTRTTASSDSISSPQIPLDPWSLGPDVFALTSHSQMVVDDTVQRDQSVVEDQAEPKVAVESLESSRKLRAPDATSNAELPVSTSGLQMPNSDIADSDTIFTVQLGTFLDRVKAQEFYDRASSVLGIKGSIQGDWPFFRLRFGEFLTRTSADSLHRVAMSCGFYDARVLKTTPSQ